MSLYNSDTEIDFSDLDTDYQVTTAELENAESEEYDDIQPLSLQKNHQRYLFHKILFFWFFVFNFSAIFGLLASTLMIALT